MEALFDAVAFFLNAIITSLINGAFLAIAYALIIMIFAAFITIYVESYVIRAVGLLALAGITYLMLPLAEIGVAFLNLPTSQVPLAEIYLQGLIFEFIGAFGILILFESALTNDRRTFVPLATFTLLTGAIALTGLPFRWFDREWGIEIAVALVGTFLVTMMLRRDWWWDTRRRWFANAGVDKDIVSYGGNDDAFAEAVGEADVQMKLIARSEGELQLKRQRLETSMNILAKSSITENMRTGMVTQMIAGKFRQTLDEQPLQPDEVRVSVRGTVNLTRESAERIAKIFSVHEQENRPSPYKGEIQTHLTVHVPEQSLEDAMFHHFQELVVNWRESAQTAKAQTDTPDPRKNAFYEGLARANLQASQQLVEKLDNLTI